MKGLPWAPNGTLTQTHIFVPLSQLQQKVQVMKNIGYLEVLLFGLDTWKSLASLQIVASVCTFAQEMGANLLLLTLKHADKESSMKSLKIVT